MTSNFPNPANRLGKSIEQLIGVPSLLNCYLYYGYKFPRMHLQNMTQGKFFIKGMHLALFNQDILSLIFLALLRQYFRKSDTLRPLASIRLVCRTWIESARSLYVRYESLDIRDVALCHLYRAPQISLKEDQRALETVCSTCMEWEYVKFFMKAANIETLQFLYARRPRLRFQKNKSAVLRRKDLAIHQALKLKALMGDFTGLKESHRTSPDADDWVYVNLRYPLMPLDTTCSNGLYRAFKLYFHELLGQKAVTLCGAIPIETMVKVLLLDGPSITEFSWSSHLAMCTLYKLYRRGDIETAKSYFSPLVSVIDEIGTPLIAHILSLPIFFAFLAQSRSFFKFLSDSEIDFTLYKSVHGSALTLADLASIVQSNFFFIPPIFIECVMDYPLDMGNYSNLLQIWKFSKEHLSKNLRALSEGSSSKKIRLFFSWHDFL